ncbi:MAG: M15 family metallopeptidase [Pseudomonadota bacterium]
MTVETIGGGAYRDEWVGDLEARARAAIRQLGGDPRLLKERDLPLYADGTGLVVGDTSRRGIEHRLTPVAAQAWQSMKRSAAEDQVSLILISGFRSFARQFEIVRRRVEAGEAIDAVFRVLAPPGCSQHHSGRALDIGTLGCEPASHHFARTLAYDWLCRRAGEFGFVLSYPEGNRFGYAYEPWHWYLPQANHGQTS